MSKATKFATTIAIDGLIAYMYFLWQMRGIEQAGNVFMFVIWFTGVLGVLCTFLPFSAKEYRDKFVAHRLFCNAASIAFLVGALWAGHFVAASLYAWAGVVAVAHQAQAKELAGAAR